MANAFKQKQDQNMTKAQNATGGDFTLTFALGMPPPAYGPNVYLLYDGSLAMGELVWKDGK